MGPFGIAEIAFIFVVALLIFGPKKLPEIGKTLGKGMREFKKATSDLKSNWEEQMKDVESPVQDLKQALNEVKSNVEESMDPDAEPAPLSADAEETSTTANPEEAKPDARTN